MRVSPIDYRIFLMLLIVLCCPGALFSQPVPKRAEVELNHGMERLYEVAEHINAAEELLLEATDGSDLREVREHFTSAVELWPERADIYYDIAARCQRTADLNPSIATEAQELAGDYFERFLARAKPYSATWAQGNMQVGTRAFYKWENERDRNALLRAEEHLLAAYDYYLDEEQPLRLSELEVFLGDIAYAQRDKERALRFYRVAIEHGNVMDYARLVYSSTLLLGWLGRPDEALTFLEARKRRSYSLNSLDRAQLLLAYVVAYRELEQYDTALQYLELLETLITKDELISQVPQLLKLFLADIYQQRGSIYFELGDGSSTEDWYRQALANAPQEATYANNLAWIIAIRAPLGSSSLDEALQLSMQAIEADDNAANLDTLAEVLFRLERYDEALEVIEEALLQYPNEPYLESQREKIEAARQGEAVDMGQIHDLRVWEPPKISL